jgi:5-methyltetrahydrofolate--homocysteine methyltransferase
MDDKAYLEALKQAVLRRDYAEVVKAAREAMDGGVDPLRAISEAMSPAMALVGEKFQSGEIFLPELIVAGDVMKEGLKIIRPHVKDEDSRKGEKVVIATVEGDLHDIGKSIVSMLLRARGFEVVDLGVDVAARKVVEVVKEHGPVIVGLSALLTLTMPKMGEVISALESEGIRQRVKVIIGGTSVTPQFAERIQADHSSTNAAEGVEKCVEWIKAWERGGD